MCAHAHTGVSGQIPEMYNIWPSLSKDDKASSCPRLEVLMSKEMGKDRAAH